MWIRALRTWMMLVASFFHIYETTVAILWYICSIYVSALKLWSALLPLLFQ